MLLQAADVPLDPFLTTPQLLTGLLLLLLSAFMKAFVAAVDEADRGQARLGRRARGAARMLQYLSLLAAAFVFAADAGFTGRSALLLLGLFVAYLGLVLLARIAATLAPDPLLRALRPLVRAWTVLAAPVVQLGERAVAWAEARRKPEEQPTLVDSLGSWLESAGIEEERAALLVEAARFHERSVGDLMVPRPDVVWLSTEDEPARIAQQIRGSVHSRFPLCEGSTDQVIGYVHIRDLGLRPGALPATTAELRALARPMGFVPETADAISLLKRFQRDRAHMAVVVDEFGGTAGIVTLEDILEALVGDIRDEFDSAEEPDELIRLPGGEVIADGSMRLEELQREFGVDFGDVEEETVGGFIFGRLAREVASGDEVTIPGATLRVEGVEGLRVTRVRLVPEAPPLPAGEATVAELAGGGGF